MTVIHATNDPDGGIDPRIGKVPNLGNYKSYKLLSRSNVAIKMAEATADFLFRTLREEIPKTLSGMLGGLLIRPGVRQIRDRIDWREFGGAPLLGIDGVAVVAHGRSDARAMKNAIRVTRDAIENQLVGKIRAEVGRA